MTKRYRPAARQPGPPPAGAAPAKGEEARRKGGAAPAIPAAPPLPENPYRRFFTAPRRFEDLARRRKP